MSAGVKEVLWMYLFINLFIYLITGGIPKFSSKYTQCDPNVSGIGLFYFICDKNKKVQNLYRSTLLVVK